MKETMSKSGGIGIAAPQIGESVKIVVIELKGGKRANGEEMPKFPLTICINPVIVRKSKKMEMGEEGCLSVRWLYGKVERSTRASITAINEKGEKISRGASGLLAQIFQHECDHLNGILFTDKTDDVWEMTVEEIKELQEK